MNEIAKQCKQLKKNFQPKIKDPTQPVSTWSEKDVLDKKIVNTFVIIFRTRGCTWALKSGCSMCGYFNDSLWKNITDEDFLKQFQKIMEKYQDQKYIKIFTSGSFLDPKEIKPKIRNKILKTLYETAEKVSVESRPEYITQNNLSEIKKITKTKKFQIGIGLETSNDELREKIINKGFTYEEYKKSIKNLKKYNYTSKTYVIVKPPSLTEKESINDSIQTIKKIKNLTETISLNPINIQKNTVVEYLWKRKQYRPPYLWSIQEILKQGKKITPDKRIQCSIVGGGSPRGAHNCKKCDKKILKSINDFSLKQDTKILKKQDCECYNKWLDLLEIEKLSFGSIVDI